MYLPIFLILQILLMVNDTFFCGVTNSNFNHVLPSILAVCHLQTQNGALCVVTRHWGVWWSVSIWWIWNECWLSLVSLGWVSETPWLGSGKENGFVVDFWFHTGHEHHSPGPLLFLNLISTPTEGCLFDPDDDWHRPSSNLLVDIAGTFWPISTRLRTTDKAHSIQWLHSKWVVQTKAQKHSHT